MNIVQGAVSYKTPWIHGEANLTAPCFHVLLDFPKLSIPLLKYCVVLEAAGFQDF